MKEFNVSDHDTHELKIAYKILKGLLSSIESARVDTMRKNEEVTPNEAFLLVTEIKAYANILDTIQDEIGLQELDMQEEASE